MKKRIGLLLLALSTCALGQGVRYNDQLMTTSGNVPFGAMAPLLSLPNASISICVVASSPCTPVTVYSDVALSLAVAQPLKTDAAGRFGFYVAPGNYYFSAVTLTGQTLLPFPFSVLGGGGGASGVPSVNGITSAVTVAGGSGVSVTTSGATITIALPTAFTINSFTGCGGSLELGASITNPVCSASYGGTPASAQITNTDSVDSPLMLSSPFTSGTIAGTFSHSTVASTTVTLTAVGSSTQTATQTYTWNPRIFGGVGDSGATGYVTSSGTTAVLSNTNILPSIQLGAETVGETFGPYTASGQVIFLLLTGGSHSFIDANTGFPFAMNAPIAVGFVNVNGTTVPLYLYQSTNPLYGSYAPKATS
jgi:hypothetical protein